MQLGVNGGSVSGITVIVSDALADGTALLVDASQLLTASTPLKLDASENAVIDMAGGNSPTFSLWQKNAVGLRAERMVAYLHALRVIPPSQFLSGVGYSGAARHDARAEKDAATRFKTWNPLYPRKRCRKSAAVG